MSHVRIVILLLRIRLVWCASVRIIFLWCRLWCTTLVQPLTVCVVVTVSLHNHFICNIFFGIALQPTWTSCSEQCCFMFVSRVCVCVVRRADWSPRENSEHSEITRLAVTSHAGHTYPT